MWYLIWRSDNWNRFPASTCVSLQCSSDTSCNRGCGNSYGPKPATQCGGHPAWPLKITEHNMQTALGKHVARIEWTGSIRISLTYKRTGKLNLHTHTHTHIYIYIFPPGPIPPKPLMGQRLLILEAPRSHTHTHTHSVGILWKSDRLVAETSTWQHTTLTTDRLSCTRWDSMP